MSTGSENSSECGVRSEEGQCGVSSLHPALTSANARVQGCAECGVKRMVILYITDNGRKLAERLTVNYSNAETVKFAPGIVADLWGRHDALVFIMASGIVVRTIALNNI